MAEEGGAGADAGAAAGAAGHAALDDEERALRDAGGRDCRERNKETEQMSAIELVEKSQLTSGPT